MLAIVPSALLIGMLPRKWLLPSGAAICALGVNSWIGPTLAFDQLEGTANLHQLFERYAAQGRQGLYGLQDYSLIDPPDLREKMKYAKEIVLVGDTQVLLPADADVEDPLLHGLRSEYRRRSRYL